MRIPMRFFLFFLASAVAAGPLDRDMCASVVDLGIVDGSAGIVALGLEMVQGRNLGVERLVWWV